MAHHPAITISRTLGSGGNEIGFLLARQLGWQFCDRRILRQAAQDSGVPLSRLRYQEERTCGFWDQFLYLLAVSSPEAYAPPLEMPVYSTELFGWEANAMRKLVEQGPSVLVGRGGIIALQGRPFTLHISIKADMDFRARRLLAQGKAASLPEAKRLAEGSDRDRAAFIREISGLDWSDSANFDLVLDSSQLGIDGCAFRLVEEVRNRLSNPPGPDED